jgi:hypothetical protein
MNKSVFDKMSDSYENFHLKDSQIGKGNDIIVISPKLKLTFGWSIFVLCCVLAYALVGLPFVNAAKQVTKEDKEAVLDEKVDVDEEHDTMIPYEKDADEELNTFINNYFTAITSCDYLRLQDMVTDSSEYSDDESLKKKAEFITSYDNITIYTKEGLDEGSYIAFVVANLTIAGVNSSPYDIVTLYVVNGERGYMINNGTLSEDVQDYIEKVKGDADIQKVYKAVEKKNEELKEKDSSLQQFYDIISRRDVETQSAADGTSEEDSQTDGETAGEETQDENQSETQEGTQSETQDNTDNNNEEEQE